MSKTLSVLQILECLPEKLLSDTAYATNVDHSVSKLKAKALLELFIYSSLHSKRISQRILSSIYESKRFRKLFNVRAKLSYSTISMRLASINCKYFELIFNHLVQHTLIREVCFGNKKISIHKLDSTFVTLSSKLLSLGMHMNPGTKNIKYGVVIQDHIPVSVKLFTDTKDISDNTTFMDSLKESAQNPLVINIFDRGLHKFEHFYTLQRENILFVTRLKNNVKLTAETKPTVIKKDSNSLINITEQQCSFARDGTTTFRIITGTTKDTQEQIRFITNISLLSAIEVTDLYKARWEIEIFFKFIKQELNFSHLLSRNQNGMQVVMYLTMITAILLSVYKKANNLTNWVIIKMKFCEELEMLILENWAQEIYQARKSVESLEKVRKKGGCGDFEQ
jgi:hypothetical protein